MSKHTPGPWDFHCGVDYVRISKTSDNSEIAEYRAWPQQNAEDEANARLIAAAPELLEHLKYAVKCAKYCHAKHPDVQKGDGIPAFVMWEAAIAKAEGGAT